MPITQREGKWYWGSKGPYKSRKEAEDVQRAAYASGYGVQQKIEKLEMGAPMDGVKRELTASELEKRKKHLVKHYLLEEGEHSTQSPRGKSKPANPPVAHSHTHSHHLHKEDGGGDGFAGTAFTSEGAGIFDPTFGERGKKKKTGIERLEDFIRDRTPIKLDVNKMESHGTVANGKMGPVRIDWEKKKVSEEDVQKVVEHEGEQNHTTPVKDSKDKQKSLQQVISDIQDDEREKELQLQYGFGQSGGQDDELHRGNPKDTLNRNPRDDEDEEEEESNIPEEVDLKNGKKSGKILSKAQYIDSWMLDFDKEY